DGKKKVDVFALSIYGLVIFPRALGHVDEAVSDLFDRLDKGVTPGPAILAETFRYLKACRRAGEGRFIGCAQLLLAWFHSHFWKVDKISYRVFSKHYSLLKEIVATPRRDDISEENWIAILQNLQEEDVEWRAPWLIPNRILYHCGSFDWVPFLGIWGAIGSVPLLVLRQYGSRQFVPATHGLAQCEFSYRGDNYKKKWRSKRVNDNIPELNLEGAQPMEEYLQVIPSELDIIKQDFERKNLELEKKIERLVKENMHLRLDTDVQKLETEKLRKGKNKAEEDLDSLKTDYKKLRLSIRTAGLGKSSEQWRQEIQEERNKTDRWERKFQETQVQKETLARQMLETQNHQAELKTRIAELERSLALYGSRNSVVELKAGLYKIEEMKKRIEELEYALQGCGQRIEFLEGNEERWREQLYHLQNQIQNRDYIMGKAVSQIREVANHSQTMAIQADVLSVKYELESDRG
ncbi:hypothetical protein Gotur_029740, partial [Gossypium turneri]